MNKVFLIGNVGKDPETRVFEDGTKMATFSLATSETFMNKKNEKITLTEWHNIVCTKGIADVVEKYVKKGQQLGIEGKLKTRSWENRDGEKRYITEVTITNMEMLGRKSESNNSRSSAPSPEPENSSPDTPEPDDDLPF